MEALFGSAVYKSGLISKNPINKTLSMIVQPKNTELFTDDEVRRLFNPAELM